MNNPSRARQAISLRLVARPARPVAVPSSAPAAAMPERTAASGSVRAARSPAQLASRACPSILTSQMPHDPARECCVRADRSVKYLTVALSFRRSQAVFLYLLNFATLSLAMMLSGVDFLTSTSAVAQAMANAGPGLGEVIGPAGNFASPPDPAKWIVSSLRSFSNAAQSTNAAIRSRWRLRPEPPSTSRGRPFSPPGPRAARSRSCCRYGR